MKTPVPTVESAKSPSTKPDVNSPTTELHVKTPDEEQSDEPVNKSPEVKRSPTPVKSPEPTEHVVSPKPQTPVKEHAGQYYSL